jgi:fructuronate reductase
MRLSQSSCALLPPEVAPPRYDGARVARGIVHLGLGAFHRAHQALYTDAVLATGDLRWGIIGVSLRGTAVSEALLPQDCLYSVTERHGEQASTRLVGSLRGVLHAPTALADVLGAIADPVVQIVTSTVTEKGYSQNPATGDLDTNDAGVQHDLAHPEAPRTTIGMLAEGIRRRPAEAALTVMCSDNMANNGRTLQKLLGLRRLGRSTIVESDRNPDRLS